MKGRKGNEMAKNICNLKGDSTYDLGEIRRRIEYRCANKKVTCPELDNGNINEYVRYYGIQPCKTNGRTGHAYREWYLGSDLIPFIKAFCKHTENGTCDLFIKEIREKYSSTEIIDVRATNRNQISIAEVQKETVEKPKHTITFADATQLYMDAHDFASALSRFSTTLLKVLEG